MIGKLKGIIDSYGEDFVIIDVGGVGYQAHCSARTLQSLPAPGEAATLAIETYVREDVIRLYGFGSDIEREWFRLLMTVQGVGARVALAVLGVLAPADLADRSHSETRAGADQRCGLCAHQSRLWPAAGERRRCCRCACRWRGRNGRNADPPRPQGTLPMSRGY